MWLLAVTVMASTTVAHQNRGSILNGDNGTRTMVATVAPERGRMPALGVGGNHFPRMQNWKQNR